MKKAAAVGRVERNPRFQGHMPHSPPVTRNTDFRERGRVSAPITYTHVHMYMHTYSTRARHPGNTTAGKAPMLQQNDDDVLNLFLVLSLVLKLRDVT